MLNTVQYTNILNTRQSKRHTWRLKHFLPALSSLYEQIFQAPIVIRKYEHQSNHVVPVTQLGIE